MTARLVLLCCADALTESGPAAAWLWGTLLAELAALPPRTVILLGDDRPSEALGWAASALAGLPCVSYRADGVRRARGVGGEKRWTEARRPAHQQRARAIVTAARDAAREGWQVEGLALLGGHLTGHHETIRRCVYARAEGIEVRERRLPAEFGGVVVEVKEERAA